MQTGNLSLQQAPPLSVPGRFFLTAPVFGAAAALILLCSGEGLLASRWMPGMLAITHCLVLGFFTSIMIGATQQMLPVLAGVIITRPRLVAGAIHLQWLPGIVFLIIALLHPAEWLYITALILITGALLAFLIPVAASLYQTESRSDSVPGIKLALFSLLATLLLGITLVLGYTGALPLWRPVVTDLHLAWGLIGWIGMLIIAIAWQVVPMFQITPGYPAWFRRGAVPVALILLLGKSLLTLAGGNQWMATAETVIDGLLAAGLSCFAIITLHLQSQARRKIRDSHRDFWRLGMAWLLVTALLWFAAEFTGQPLLDLLAAMAFVLGFAMTVITGMLIKILSFLIWLHLQAANEGRLLAGQPGLTVPKMKAVISARSSDRLLYVLIAAQLTLLAALVLPGWFHIPAALLWLALFCLQALVLGKAILRYRHTLRNANIESAD